MSYTDNETAKPVVFFRQAADLGPYKNPVVGYSAELLWITGHPRLGNPPRVYTSTVLEVRDDGKTIETRNTIYKKLEE